MHIEKIDVRLWQGMLTGGYINLKRNMTVVDELNVFPVPDGDTGKNMTMTIEGGVSGTRKEYDSLGEMMQKFSRSSLLSARGNSGVILSQFIRGLAIGSENLEYFTVKTFAKAFKCGCDYAYHAVATPTEGTMLTVIREASEYLEAVKMNDFADCFDRLLTVMHRSLKNTPKLLAVLREAGVVDSGGAGIVCIFEGMQSVLNGNEIEDIDIPIETRASDISFDENSELEFGYCTEFILQLQNSKTDISAFKLSDMTEKLHEFGDSIVTVQDGSLVKVHVHSFNPEDVIKYVRQYGEMITVKIENMSVQHSEIASQKPERQKFAIVATATGEGLIGFFEGVGVSVVIDGGRTNNPSAEDFIEAFKKVNAEYIVVLPNDSNVVMTAEQAAALYTDADVRVVKTKSLAEGYSALSMMDLSVDTIEHLISDMTEGLPNVSTGYVTTATRDAFISGVTIHKNDWMGLEGDTVYASTDSPVKAAQELFKKLPGIDDKQVVTAFYGKDVSEDELAELEEFFSEEHPLLEVGFIEGGQDVYRYIFAIE